MRATPSSADLPRPLTRSLTLWALALCLGALAPAEGRAEEATAPVAEPEPEPAKEPFDVTPKQTDLYVGWAMRTSSNLPDQLPAPTGGLASTEVEGAHTQGLEVVWDYTWKVGGFLHRWPSYVGFILGYVHFPGGSDHARVGVLEYGLRIKHTIFPFGKVRPFFSYGLGAVQVFVAGIEGRGIGHLTRGGLGIDVPISGRLSWSLELTYRMQSMPGFAGGARRDFHTASVLTGIAFDMNSKP